LRRDWDPGIRAGCLGAGLLLYFERWPTESIIPHWRQINMTESPDGKRQWLFVEVPPEGKAGEAMLHRIVTEGGEACIPSRHRLSKCDTREFGPAWDLVVRDFEALLPGERLLDDSVVVETVAVGKLTLPKCVTRRAEFAKTQMRAWIEYEPSATRCEEPSFYDIRRLPAECGSAAARILDELTNEDLDWGAAAQLLDVAHKERLAKRSADVSAGHDGRTWPRAMAAIGVLVLGVAAVVCVMLRHRNSGAR
jgi:hypothetical protein